jgi:hypothetical protein
MNKIICIASAALMLSACSSLKLTEDGEKVRVLEPAEISSCKDLGATNISVTDHVIFELPADTVAEQLRIVARNSAARRGGDTIVPLTVIEDGHQTFLIYKCVNPDG